jgi:hypothetical protein
MVYPALTISRTGLTNGCGWLWGSAEIGAGFSIRCGFLTQAGLHPASGAGLRFVNERIARAAAASGVFHQYSPIHQIGNVAQRRIGRAFFNRCPF